VLEPGQRETRRGNLPRLPSHHLGQTPILQEELSVAAQLVRIVA